MSQNNKNGFTLVEILVVAPIIILVIGVFINAIVNMTGDVLASRGANNMAYNIQDALNRIEQDIRLSNKFLAIKAIDATQSPQGYNDDTTSFHNASSTTGNALILEEYATTKNPMAVDKSLVYLNTPNACNVSQVTQNQPMAINVIYFVKDNTLWRRVIMPVNYSSIGCDPVALSSVTPWQQPSCNPSRSDTICKSKDTKLVDGIAANSDFNIDYFTNPDSTTENTLASDSSSSDAVRAAELSTITTAKITIHSTKNISGRDVSQAGSIKAVSPSGN